GIAHHRRLYRPVPQCRSRRHSHRRRSNEVHSVPSEVLLGQGADRPWHGGSEPFSRSLAQDLIAFAERKFGDSASKELCLSPLSYLWEAFLGIFLWGGYGMAPFKTPYMEIEAYSRMMQVPLEPWEVRIIRDLGGAYV